ncbi:MAG: DUF721 domain-containing protein [Acidimicrobiia bacterium]
MADGNDMSSFGSAMKDMFRRMGLPDPMLVGRIRDEWDDFAGHPWVGRSKPVTIQGSTLVIEANSPSLVAFLKYGSEDLLAKLSERFGAGVIDKVDVRPPQ